MENKGKTRRLRKGVVAAFILSLVAIGTSSTAKWQSVHPETCNEAVCGEKLCAAGPSTLFMGYGAYTADYYEQPTFVGDYFRNLTENFPTNNCGNCGYTAAAMLLCYYDTYWNGKIIDDHFNSDPAMIKDPKSTDYSSPGITDFAAHIDEIKKEKPKDGAPQWEWDDYNAYLVDEIYGPYLGRMDEPYLLKTNLISYLYDLARGNNKKQITLWNFGIKEPTTEASMTLVTNLLNLYFDEIGLTGLIEAKLVSYKDFKFGKFIPESIQRGMLKREAVIRLKKGQPIIYKGDIATESGYYDKNSNYIEGNAHAAIAYGLDKEGNKIVGHIGWKGEKEFSQMVFDDVFGDFDDYIYIDVKPELEFTYPNERFDAGKYLSACDLCSHIHADEDHRAKISYGDTEYHASQCICGDTEYEMHEYDEMVQFDDQKHALKCVCGDAKYEEHTLTVTPYDSLRHVFGCECGYQRKEFHHFRLGGMMRFVCSDCGYSMPAGIMPEIIYNP